MGNFHRRRLQHTTLNYRHGVSADQINWDKMEISTLVILNPAWATVSLTTGMIWDGNCHSSSLDTDQQHMPWLHVSTWARNMQVIRRRSMWEGTRGREAPFMARGGSSHQISTPLEKASASDVVSSSPQPPPQASSVHFLSPQIVWGKPSWGDCARAVTVLTMQQPHSRNFLPLKHFPFAEISFDNFVHTFPFPTLIIILFWIAFILSSCSSAECLHWSIHPVWTVNITLSQEIQRPINEPKKHYLFIRFETPFVNP